MRTSLQLLADCSQTIWYEYLVLATHTVVLGSTYVRGRKSSLGCLPGSISSFRDNRRTCCAFGRERVGDLQDSQRMMREMAQQIRDLIGGRSVLITRRMLELPSQLEQEADVLETEIRASSMKGAADELAWRPERSRRKAVRIVDRARQK